MTQFTIVLRFQAAVTFYEKTCRFFINPTSLLQLATAKNTPIHSDVIPHRDQKCDENTFLYTAYIGEHFGFSRIDVNAIANDEYTYYYLVVDEPTYDKCVAYGLGMCEKYLRYNYTDLLLIPLHPNPQNKIFKDVNTENTSSLYCSQFGLLMLRHCLDPDQHPHIVKDIQHLNSRSCSPAVLLSLIRPHFKVLTDPNQLVLHSTLVC
jgi:hypothetical protein